MNQATHSIFSDTRRIELHDPVETPYWCKLLGVTEAHLISAVETVGHGAEDVKDYLEREVELRLLEREYAASDS